MAGFSGRFRLLNLRLQRRRPPISAVNLGAPVAGERSVGGRWGSSASDAAVHVHLLQRTGREGRGSCPACTDDTMSMIGS